MKKTKKTRKTKRVKEEEKVRNYNVGYEQYSRKFYQAKRAGNLKVGMRKFSKKTYNELRARGDSTDAILDEQMFLSKKKQKEVWKKYKNLRKNLNPGEVAIYDKSYWGKNSEKEEGLGYHRTLYGLMRDKNIFHFLITNDILTSDKSREEVLAQYGY